MNTMYMIARHIFCVTNYMVAECPPVQGLVATHWGPLEVSSKMPFSRAT